MYAFLLGAKGGETVTLRSFADQDVQSVELLGAGPLEFRKDYGVLVAKLPAQLPGMCANVLKIR